MNLRLLAVTCTAALVLVGCTGDDSMTLFAEFDDVIDLVNDASVRAGDVTIGTVESITLTDDERARVEMRIDSDIVLPDDTAAWLSKTSLLGERFIDLRPQNPGGQLEDGDVIASTRIVTDFEDLVGTGSDVLAGLSAQRLATAIEAGAEALGGRGALLGQVIDDVQLLVERYEGGSGTITRVIDELAALTASLAPDAQANADDLALLRATTDALDEQDEQLFTTLSDLQRLSTVGERILEDNADMTDDAIRRLRILLEEVNRFEGRLDSLIVGLEQHNTNTPDGAVNELTQIWGEFIICGLQDEEGDVSSDCTPPNPGQTVPPPAVDPCPQENIRCPDEVDS